MTDRAVVPLRPGDRAPDFDLPAADHDARVALREYLARGPVLLYLMRGLYCPFSRRQISQMKPTCELLRDSGITFLGVVIASHERSQMYFRMGNAPCFPLAACPHRALHRAYGLAETLRTAEGIQRAKAAAERFLEEMGITDLSGELRFDSAALDPSFRATPEDHTEHARPMQTSGLFLIGTDGFIRWTQLRPTCWYRSTTGRVSRSDQSYDQLGRGVRTKADTAAARTLRDCTYGSPLLPAGRVSRRLHRTARRGRYSSERIRSGRRGLAPTGDSLVISASEDVGVVGAATSSRSATCARHGCRPMRANRAGRWPARANPRANRRR